MTAFRTIPLLLWIAALTALALAYRPLFVGGCRLALADFPPFDHA